MLRDPVEARSRLVRGSVFKIDEGYREVALASSILVRFRHLLLLE